MIHLPADHDAASGSAGTTERVAGRLVDLLPTGRRFEFEDSGRVIKGTLAAEADDDAIGLLFGEPCVAHLHVVTIERLGQTAQAFTLSRNL